MEPKVIYEDEDIFVLDKPAGWVVNEADTTKDNPVVQTWLKENFKSPLVTSRVERSGVVHRIDKETSGLLLIAKNQESFMNLQAQFKDRKVEKEYIALVHNQLKPSEGEINVPVGRLPWNRERFGVLAGGRDSTTAYNVVAYYTLNSTYYSLVELKPKTGRTHQIRIHLKYLGFPIVSDIFYAGRKTSRKDRLWCVRLFLHAAKISFYHPRTNEKISFASDLAPDLALALDSLEM